MTLAQKIGYQDGIEWLVGFVRKIPGVKYRPVAERPGSIEQWYGLEKFERTLRILKDDHDAAIVTPDPPPPPPPPPPPTTTLAPQTYNKGSRGQDARYCIAGLRQANGVFIDGGGFQYDENGLCKGGRSGNPVDGLKPSDMMDDKGPCDPYEWGGHTFPPWPEGSYRV